MIRKRGDIVGRISYGKDILFRIEKIIKLDDDRKIVLLKGITNRIVADAYIEDLEVIEKSLVAKILKEQMDKALPTPRNNNIRECRILHLDGDRKYSEKSMHYYKKMGLTAIVKNIPESRQYLHIRKLLERYKPDILVITRT
jgi:spore coat assembly protein